MNIEAPILAAQAATSIRDTAAVTATMGFVRSLSTAISVVIGGVVFQNEMNARNEELASQLGSNSSLAREFNGNLAASSVEEISTIGLNTGQQVLVRKTYFEALRIVWIMVGHLKIATRCIAVSYFCRIIYANGMSWCVLVCCLCWTCHRS